MDARSGRRSIVTVHIPFSQQTLRSGHTDYNSQDERSQLIETTNLSATVAEKTCSLFIHRSPANDTAVQGETLNEPVC